MTMRPLHLSFTPANSSVNGIIAGLTGVGPWLASAFTLTGPSDGLAHTINLVSTANLSAINITVTGTDADGVAQTETRAGPNINTVATTALFKTITSISASATLGVNTLDVGWAGVFVSPTLPVEYYRQGSAVSCQVAVTGTIGFDVEGTLSDIRAGSPTVWLKDANFTAKIANLSANLAVAHYTAIRFIANSYTNGATAVLSVITGK